MYEYRIESRTALGHVTRSSVRLPFAPYPGLIIKPGFEANFCLYVVTVTAVLDSENRFAVAYFEVVAEAR